MKTISRQAYADMFGPTTGDRLRLADTELFLEIEKDFTTYGEEVKFGGGKVIRDGMGQSQVVSAECVDVLITNAIILDYWGIVKADLGLKVGRRGRVGKAGKPDAVLYTPLTLPPILRGEPCCLAGPPPHKNTKAQSPPEP
ncbi:hypothetical protein ACEE86_08070, partial [Proteus mirabilis]